MKKTFKFLTVFLLVLLGANLQPAWAKYFYLIPSDNWKEASAKFYFRYWGGSSGEGKQITTEIDNSNIFFFNDEGISYSGWQFVRVNPNKDEIWSYGPNGVSDKNLCTFDNWDGSWSGNCYRTVAGDNPTLFGSAWQADASANDMTPSANGWTLTKRATLSKGKINFKVTVDHAWTTSYPKENVSKDIDSDGKYEIVFTCNGDGSKVGATITPIYTVSYNANGATSGIVPTDAIEYVSGSSVTVKTNSGSLAKIGYDFVGWNTEADGTGTNYSAGDIINSIQADITLYAKWHENFKSGWFMKGTFVDDWGTQYDFIKPNSTAKTGSVTLNNLNAGSDYYFMVWSPDGNYGCKDAGAKMTKLSNKWTLDGGQNVGITTTAKGSYTFTLDFTNADKPQITVTYPTDYTITFANGNSSATGTMNNMVNIAENEEVTLTANNYELGCNHFVKWKDQDNNEYTDGAQVTVTKDLTLTAQWAINRYKAIYDANGVSGYTDELPATVEYNCGDQVTVSQTPKLSKYGYTFIGWNTDPNATTALPDNYRFTIDKGDTKIYAIWDAVKPTSIAIVPESGDDQRNKGTTTQMIATLTPDASTMAEENRALTWSSSNATRAFINQKGQVSFVGVGGVTITATSNVDNNVKGTYYFNVQAGNCDGLKIRAFGDGYQEDDYFHPISSDASEWRCPYVLKNGADEFWVGECDNGDGGWQDDHSEEKSFNDIPLRDYREVKTNPAQDLVGTLVIWNDSKDKNYGICFEPTYQVSYMTDASTWRIMELYPTSDTYAYETELLQVPEGYKNNSDMKYFVGLKKADGTNVSIYNKSRQDAMNSVIGLSSDDMASKFGKWHISSNSGDMNWYCVFNQYYRLSYAGEGTDEYQSHDVLSGGTKEQRTIKLGAVPEKKGYTPRGWLIKGTLYDANSNYEIVDDAVAEAQWDPIVIKLPDDKSKEIPQYVCDLVMQEGSELKNSSITVMRKFEYIRRVDALDRWETFAMPVDVMKIQVKDGVNYYDIWPAYGSDNAGYFYMKTLEQVPEDGFQNSWEHIQNKYPSEGVPFIIQYPTSSSSGYFANKEISYICEIEGKEGITIADHAIEAGPYLAKAGGREFKFCANTNLISKQLDGTQAAYILTESGTCFDLVYGATIPPFSGYIIATEEMTARCPRMMLVGNDDTTDLIPIYKKPSINAENRKIMVNGQIFIYHAGKIYNLTGTEIY